MSQPLETRPRLLLVDDEKANITVLSAALDGAYELVVARDGEEALRLARALARPDLILLDVMMPGMDGPQTLLRLRERIDLERIPVTFMTAKVQPSEIEHLRKLGARDVIVKPFDPMQLAEQIRSIWLSGRY
jgi:CheY-like chemotaxis protein